MSASETTPPYPRFEPPAAWGTKCPRCKRMRLVEKTVLLDSGAWLQWLQACACRREKGR
jgi:hypothetical protein